MGLSTIMKNDKIKYNVEDILTNEGLVEKLAGDEKGIEGRNDRKLSLAGLIYRALIGNKSWLKPKSKQQLGENIQHSIVSYRRKLAIRRYTAAASFLIFVSVSYLYLANQHSSLKTYAENWDALPVSNNTQLILSDDETIAINSTESEIDYSESGNVIDIDDSEKVNQDIDSQKPVMNTVLVPFGKRTHVTLSDNSSVWLNSGSRLVFPARFDKTQREVYLEGEAIFEVSHDKTHPFHVLTKDLEIEVLGTVFNVSAYRDDKETSAVLVEGSVELSYQGTSFVGKREEKMVPGYLASYNPESSSLNQKAVNTDLYTSWRMGYLIFEREPLPAIVRKVARYYNVDIRLADPELEKETFSGNLDLRNSASELLQIVAEIVSAKVQKQGNQIIITRI